MCFQTGQSVFLMRTHVCPSSPSASRSFAPCPCAPTRESSFYSLYHKNGYKAATGGGGRGLTASHLATNRICGDTSYSRNVDGHIGQDTTTRIIDNYVPGSKESNL